MTSRYCPNCWGRREDCTCDKAQSSLFDVEQAKAAKTEAIDRVERHADSEWKDEAYRVVSAICHTRPEFTTDDVWRLLDGSTHEPRAMGAVMRKAAIAGLCRKTNRVRESERVTCHRRPVAIWESLV